MTIQRASPFAVIEAADLPDYPIEKATRLTAHYFTMWWHDRWLNSTLHLKGSYEVQGVAFALFNIAQRQAPIGTLPDDDELLAKLLRLDMPRWRDLRAMPVNPLHNWTRCNCEGEVRLMHPVVTEVALEAISKREARDLSKEEKAIAQRLKRLREGLSKLGYDKAVLSDDILIRRMDDWLSEHWKSNRTAAAYQRIAMVAARERWFEQI